MWVKLGRKILFPRFALMTNMRYAFLLATLPLVLLVGCGPPSNARVIKKMVAESNAAKRSIIDSAEGMFTDVKTYRDGEAEGIVYEFTVNEKSSVKKEHINPETRKDLLANPRIRELLERDIYQVYRYKTKGGDVWAEFKLTKADL